MRNLSTPEISNDLIAILKRGGDISAETVGLKKHQIEEVRQYSDTWLLMLDARLRASNTINDAMRGREVRPSVNDREINGIKKDIELFNALRSQMTALL